jgi:hypothetical protein
VDIVEPLIAVLKFADEECNNRNRQRRITAEVMPLLRELGEQRIETDADESIAALCDLLDTMLQSTGAGRKFIPSEQLLHEAMKTPALRGITSTKSLAMFMSKFDLNSRRNTTGKKRGYFISKGIVADLRLPYLSEASDVSSPPRDSAH